MKRNLRKFLSLLMVIALLCGMVPAAFAAVDQSDIDWEVSIDGDNWLNVYYCQSFGHEHEFLYSYGGYDYYECKRCGAVGTIESNSNREDYYEDLVGGHTHRYTYVNSTYHEVECFTDQNCEYWVAQQERHTGANCICMGLSSSDSELVWESNSSVCLDNDNPSRYHDPVYWKTEGDYYVYKCYYCGEVAYESKDGSSVSANGLSVEQADDMSGNNTYTANENVTLRVYPTVIKNGINITVDCTFTYEWSGDITSASTTSSAKLDTTKAECSVSCTITAKDSTGAVIDTATVTWYATEGVPIEVEATIFNNNTGYYLSDVDDDGYTSIEEQIVAAVDALEGRYDDFTLEYVKFGDVDETGGKLSATTSREYYYYAYSSSTYTLGQVTFTPTAKYVGKVVFPFTVYYENDNNSNNALAYASGTLTFDVQESNSLGIVYTAVAGEDVILDEADFVKFWEEAYPYGALDYVRFDSILSSKGKLYDAASKQLGTTTKCYYYPSRSSDVALEGVTFVPKSTTVTGAVEITFNAYGSTRTNGTTSSTPVSGKVTILYTAKEVTPVEYLSTGTAITLKSDDFLAKYKEVMDAKTATASSLNIQFLEAPTYGSLYLNYKATSYNTGTALTSKNILNFTFNGKSTATRSIEDVTYVPGTYSAVGETLHYACYYNNQLKFVGTVTFGAADPIVIEYTTSGVSPVTFSAYDFYNASLSSGYLYFGTPSYGTLYRSYANGTGIRVNPYDTFSTSASSYGSVYSLSTLTYVPAPGYVGVVEIPVYTAATLYNTQVMGTVKIYVGRTFSDIAGTSHVWAQPYIDKLSAQGIVNGTGTRTTYEPGKELSYGEALALIMRAVGYSELAPVNSHWASGFLTKAYYDGLVGSSAIDLNAPINRDTVASITAKALKLNYATNVNFGVTPPSDSTNGYVYALYNAGIVNGVNVGGYNYWYGSKTITRAEISKIICMISDYAKDN